MISTAAKKLIVLSFVAALLISGTAGPAISAADSSSSDKRLPVVPQDQSEEESEEESLSEIDPTDETQFFSIWRFAEFGQPNWQLWVRSYEPLCREPIAHQPDASRAPPSSKR